MYIALNSDNKRISIDNTVAGEQYYCLVCGAELTIKAKESLAVKAHFAHKKGKVCLDDWSNDMSEWHLNWQQQFPVQYREVIIENNGIKHRADICIGNTVIEFQHSPLSKEEFSNRNTFYTNSGYDVVWVFDAEGKIKNYLEDSIDPMKCREDDLCWKRPKQTFDIKILPQVQVYIQYKTLISNDNYAGELFDILLKLKKLSQNFSLSIRQCQYI